MSAATPQVPPLVADGPRGLTDDRRGSVASLSTYGTAPMCPAPCSRLPSAPYRPGMLPTATSWGATEAEQVARYPCDEFASPGSRGFFRAVDVSAPPPVLYRWLCQLRVAPYSYDLIDNGGRRSPRTLTPGLDDLAVGQTLMGIFRVVAFERDVHLTAVLRPGASRVFGPIALSYVLRPAPGGSRLVCVQRVGRAAVLDGLRRSALGWGDLVMMRKQLLTLRDLAER